jgi:hypothetical protein
MPITTMMRTAAVPIERLVPVAFASRASTFWPMSL